MAFQNNDVASISITCTPGNPEQVRQVSDGNIKLESIYYYLQMKHAFQVGLACPC